MPIDQFDLFNRFCSDNNTFQGGFVRPARDFERIINSLSQDIWNEWTAQDEKTQEINDNLAPFKKTVNIIVSPASGNYGIAKYPPNYGRYSAARVLLHKSEQKETTCICDSSKDTFEEGQCVKEGHKETDLEKAERIELYKDGIIEGRIDKIEGSKWASYLEHETKGPTFEKPGLTQFETGFKVAPRQVSRVALDYYIAPKYAKFAYTIAPGNPQTGAGDYIIYDASNSGKLEWPDTMIPFFLEKLRPIYARYTRDGGLFQMSKNP